MHSSWLQSSSTVSVVTKDLTSWERVLFRLSHKRGFRWRSQTKTSLIRACTPLILIQHLPKFTYPLKNSRIPIVCMAASGQLMADIADAHICQACSNGNVQCTGDLISLLNKHECELSRTLRCFVIQNPPQFIPNMFHWITILWFDCQPISIQK